MDERRSSLPRVDHGGVKILGHSWSAEFIDRFPIALRASIVGGVQNEKRNRGALKVVVFFSDLFSADPRKSAHSAGTVPWGEDMDKFSMDRFVNAQNLEIFRQLASSAIDDGERKVLLELLAEQEAQFAELQKVLSQPKRGESATKDVMT